MSETVGLFRGCSGDVRTDENREWYRHERLGQLDCVELLKVDVLEAGGTDVQLCLTTDVTPVEQRLERTTKDPLEEPPRSSFSYHVLHEKQLAALHATC